MSIQVLETVRRELKACGAITSNQEFCAGWLAKDESYLRVLRFHKTEPSADALAICASKLGYYVQHLRHSAAPLHQEWVLRFERLHRLCLQAMEDQARTKWMTPERMGI